MEGRRAGGEVYCQYSAYHLCQQARGYRDKYDGKIKKEHLKNSGLFLNDQTNYNTLRNAHAIFLNPRSCLSTSTLALASSIVMKSRIFTKYIFLKKQLLAATLKLEKHVFRKGFLLQRRVELWGFHHFVQQNNQSAH